MSEFDGVADLVPDGCVPIHAVRAVEYLNPDGTSDFNFQAWGNTLLSGTIGMLEIVKNSYVQMTLGDEHDDE